MLVIKLRIYWRFFERLTVCAVGSESRWSWTWWRLICWRRVRGDSTKFKRDFFSRSSTSPFWLATCNVCYITHTGSKQAYHAMH